MARIRLIHWSPTGAAERAERLRSAGYGVTAGSVDGPPDLKRLRSAPPAAVVIDLGRAPGRGRDVGLALRTYKATRRVPLIFVGGEPGTVERLRALLPDATFTTWRALRGALRKAIADPVASPVVPPSALAGYSGTPLPAKLGIKAGAVVHLRAAPEGVETTIGELPEGARLVRRRRGDVDLVLWFVLARRELARGMTDVVAATPAGGTWILWPKKASGVATDVSQTTVRELGLGAGLVDYKVASFDATWSGLKFARRKR